MFRPVAVLATTLLLLAAGATAAQAATLTTNTTASGLTLNVSGSGERNDVDVSVANGTVVVRDTSAVFVLVVDASGTCTRDATWHEVDCPLAPGATLNVNASVGGGNDTVNVHDGNGGTLSGGSGSDTITGSPGVDLITGGSGSDTLDGGAGNDTIYDNTYAGPDTETDTLIGGAGIDALFSRGGIDSLQGGADSDYVFARDADTAPATAMATTPDTVDCGDATDYYSVDTADALTACESVYDVCVSPPYPNTTPACPVAATGSGGGGGGGGGAVKEAEAPAPVVADPAPAPAAAIVLPVTTKAPPAPPAPLQLGFALDLHRLRAPLSMIPRGLVTLSETAELTITYARESKGKRIGRKGVLQRTVGAGERNISLTVLLGGRQQFPPGRYWVTVTARAADGRTATAEASLQVLAARRSKR